MAALLWWCSYINLTYQECLHITVAQVIRYIKILEIAYISSYFTFVCTFLIHLQFKQRHRVEDLEGKHLGDDVWHRNITRFNSVEIYSSSSLQKNPVHEFNTCNVNNVRGAKSISKTITEVLSVSSADFSREVRKSC